MNLTAAGSVEPSAPSDDFVLRNILSLLHERTGTDFSCYRPATVRRRIVNRMIAAGAAAIEDYCEILRGDPDEALKLLERITIKVSRFYRNSEVFDLLRARILPELATRRGGRPLRIWSAGCGCGEEPYTLAMLLAETGMPGIVMATDVSPAALIAARAGRYPASVLHELPDELRERYLVPAADQVAESFDVSPALRERVRFLRHDLVSEASHPGGAEPFDLVCCRNVIIYFDQPTQQQVLDRLRLCLEDSGYLCLGEAEWPVPQLASTLTTLGHRTRLFRATPPGQRSRAA